MPASPSDFQVAFTDLSNLLTAEEIASVAAFANSLDDSLSESSLKHKLSDFLISHPAIDAKLMVIPIESNRIANITPSIDPKKFKDSIRNTILKTQVKAKGTTSKDGGSTAPC